jgi:hypothetical protein
LKLAAVGKVVPFNLGTDLAIVELIVVAAALMRSK